MLPIRVLSNLIPRIKIQIVLSIKQLKGKLLISKIKVFNLSDDSDNLKVPFGIIHLIHSFETGKIYDLS